MRIPANAIDGGTMFFDNITVASRFPFHHTDYARQSFAKAIKSRI
jgi:hypothetical protein